MPADWLTRAIPRAPSPEAVRTAHREPETGSIRLDALAGPSETMTAAGFTNRGSLAYAMKERGFPEPVKVLRGIRLWDLDAVNEWRRSLEE